MASYLIRHCLQKWGTALSPHLQNEPVTPALDSCKSTQSTTVWNHTHSCPPFSLCAVPAASGGASTVGVRSSLPAILHLHAGEELQRALRPLRPGWAPQRVSLRGLRHQPGQKQAQVLVRKGLWYPALPQVSLSGPQQHLLHYPRSLQGLLNVVLRCSRSVCLLLWARWTFLSFFV